MGIFVEFNRQSPECLVKKSKRFKQTDFMLEHSSVQHEQSNDGKIGKVSTPVLSQSSLMDYDVSGKNTVATINNFIKR